MTLTVDTRVYGTNDRHHFHLIHNGSCICYGRGSSEAEARAAAIAATEAFIAELQEWVREEKKKR